MSTIAVFLTCALTMFHVPVVVLDPGHGGSNTGTRTLRQGIYEKDLTLDVALRTKRLLESAGLVVRLTRSDDRYVPLRTRSEIAAGSSCFVSLHFNSSKVHDRKGVEVFVATGRMVPTSAMASSPMVAAALRHRSRLLAEEVARSLGAVRVDEGEYHVLDGIRVPAVLVELGFADHPDEGRRILAPSYRQELAKRLARALARACGGAPR